MVKAVIQQLQQDVANHLTKLIKERLTETCLKEAMLYAVQSGGKRIRPLLTLAVGFAGTASNEAVLDLACALEMIHTYSLIHDDLPAMDNDDYRRGKLTNHKVFGDGIAILAGDGLLTLAFTVILRQQDVSADTLLCVVDEISRAAGAEGMVGGQVLDLRAEEHRISMEEMRRVHMGKTGALFRAALRRHRRLRGRRSRRRQCRLRHRRGRPYRQR